MVKLTKEQRIAKIEEIHPNKFTYEFMEESTPPDKKFTITCPIHGNFRITMSSLLSSKYGCSKCGNKIKGERTKKTTSSFIEEAKLVHGNAYSYDKVDYVGAHTHVTVTCPAHGDFLVKPYVHLQKHKCRKCAYEDNSISKRVAVKNKPTYLYYIKFLEQEIWKVGCSIDIERRLLGLSYDLLFSKLYEDSREAYFVESWVLKATSGNVYKGEECPIEKGKSELRSSKVPIKSLVLEAEAIFKELVL